MRYRVVTLSALLLALAAGIILGDGPLRGDDAVAAVSGSGNADELAQAREQLREQAQGLEVADSYAAATGGPLTAGSLAGRAVTIVTLPGADEEAVTRVQSAIGTAGGSVAGQVGLADGLLDVSQRQLVSELARQMDVGPAKKALGVPKDAGDYERVSRMLAYALLTKDPGGDQPDRVAGGIMAGLTTADLVTVEGATEGEAGGAGSGGAATVTRRGNVVIVVGDAPYGSADERAGAGSILTELLTAFDEAGAGTVLAGPVGASAPDGLVTAVRQAPEVARKVSLVDVVDQAAGAVVTVLALAADVGGRPGDWGTSAAADGALPAAPEKKDTKGD
jgi:hypothetical protein